MSLRPVLARAMGLAIVVLSPGCRQVLDDFHVSNADTGDGALCAEPGYPPPPSAGTSPGNLEFTVAMRTLDWGDQVESGMPTYSRVGLNLDSRCTTSVETSSCLLPSGAATSQFQDGPGGIDNAAGQFAWHVQGAGVITAAVRATEASGEAVTLLRVRGYDGMPDDDHVEAALFVGTRKASDAAAPEEPPPDWQGHDSWSTTAIFVEGGNLDTPQFVDRTAYVRGGKLVAKFSTVLQGGPFTVFGTLRGYVLTGTIVPRDGSYGLEAGVRGARWPVGGVLSFIAKVLSGSQCGVAPTSAFRSVYEQGKAAACEFVDVRAEGDDPSSPCDALSVGVRFEGVPARIASVLPNPAAPACAEDSCPAIAAAASDAAADAQ